MDGIIIRFENDQMLVTSLQVAKDFGKEHRNVLRDIESLKDVLNFEQMFNLTNIPDTYGRNRKAYLINRDGFTLLAMGFTGKDALEWKLKYIQAFNQMEEKLNSPEFIMDRALKISKKQIDELMLENNQIKFQNNQLTVEKEIMRPKAEFFDELVDRKLNTGIRETAKELKVKEKQFVTFLLEHKYLYRNKRGKLVPFAQYVGDLFEIKETFNEKTNWSGIQTLITPKGRETFRLLCESV